MRSVRELNGFLYGVRGDLEGVRGAIRTLDSKVMFHLEAISRKLDRNTGQVEKIEADVKRQTGKFDAIRADVRQDVKDVVGQALVNTAIDTARAEEERKQAERARETMQETARDFRENVQTAIAREPTGPVQLAVAIAVAEEPPQEVIDLARNSSERFVRWLWPRRWGTPTLRRAIAGSAAMTFIGSGAGYLGWESISELIKYLF